MDKYTATEQAYKNGYEDGKRDATDKNVGCKNLLKRSIVVIRKQWQLFWIGWYLDRSLRAHKKAIYMHGKALRLADRYNYIFTDDLFGDIAKEGE